MSLAFDDLTPSQGKLIEQFVALINTGKYQGEFVAHVDAMDNCYVNLHSADESGPSTLHVFETDLLHLNDTGYLTLILTSDRRKGQGPSGEKFAPMGGRPNATYKLGIKPKAFDSYAAYRELEPTIIEDPNNPPIIELRRFLSSSFNLEEIKTLCFDLGMDFDDLPGDSKTTKVVSLLQKLHKEGRKSELLKHPDYLDRRSLRLPDDYLA